jgi:hypothetical protein
MWFDGMPVARTASWQDAQARPESFAALCSNLTAGEKPVVLWQAPQIKFVGMCSDGFPLTLNPLWQFWQPVASTITWLNTTPEKLDSEGEWHVSHAAAVGMCLSGLKDAPRALF